jgi:hypothetical protein
VGPAGVCPVNVVQVNVLPVDMPGHSISK